MPSKPTLIQSDFTSGIRRSRARDDLGRSQGANVLWDTRDFIIGRLGVPLGKRGGWGHQGTGITADSLRSITNDPFNGGNYMRAVSKDGTVWRAQGPGYSTWTEDTLTGPSPLDVGGVLKQNGVFIADNLFYPSPDGDIQPFTFNETQGFPWPQAPGGAGSYVTYLATHLNRLVGLDTHENVWFGAPNITLTAWDDDAKYNLGQPGRGLIGLGGELLIFFDGRTKKLKGSVPAGYGVTQDDISIQDFSGDIGCVDAYSICLWKTQAIWVDHSGIWTTDGATYPLDLSWAGGAQDLFVEFMRNYVDRGTTRVAAGVHSNMLIVTMTDIAEDEFIDCLVCDLNKRTWSRWQNSPFVAFARGALDASETWAAIGNDDNVATISPVLLPTSVNSADGDGTDVEPSFETAYYRLGPQDSRIHRAYLGYEIDFLESEVAAEFATAELDFLGVEFEWTALVAGEAMNGVTVIINLDDSVVEWTPLTATWYPGLQMQITGPHTGTTAQDIVDVVNALAIGVSGTTTSPGATFASPYSQGFTLAGGVDAPDMEPVGLEMTYATDPRAEPEFLSYREQVVELQPRDIHGDPDPGYHWKQVYIRDMAGGVAIRCEQVGPSAKTSIHGVGLEAQPHPTYSER
jgi:hypothetical protein